MQFALSDTPPGDDAAPIREMWDNLIRVIGRLYRFVLALSHFSFIIY